MDVQDNLLTGSDVPHRSDTGGDGLWTQRLDRAIEAVLIALLAFGPFAFGVVHAWSEQIVVALAALLVLLFLIQRIFIRPRPLVRTWAYLPVAAFLLVVAFQLIPLPTGVLGAISPETHLLKTELLSDLPGEVVLPSRTPLTFYARATKHDLRLLLAIAAVFFVVVNVYREPGAIKRLLGAIALVGGAVGLLALAQDVAGNGRIYWVVPAYDRARSGPFINHSHFGQFMNLSMGAALALLLVCVHEAFARRRLTPAAVFDYMNSPQSRPVKLLAAAIALGAAAVFVSLTRGGMVSLLFAAAFTTVVLTSRRSLQGRAWIIVLIALGAFLCILWVGFDQVYDRMATLDNLSEYHGRWQMIENTVDAWKRFPAFGTGLGTYEVVYPMFDRGTSASLATHAENEYVQALAETGLVGFMMLAALGIAIWLSYAANVSRGSTAVHSAAYGLGFGLAAILVHSLSDFGQHLPANAMLTAVCCALLVSLAAFRSGPSPSTAVCPPAPRRGPYLVLGAIAAGAFGWSLAGANAARIAQGHWNKARAVAQQAEEFQWRLGEEATTYLFTHAAAAAAAEPDNIQYWHRLGVYKWMSLTPFIDPNTHLLDPQALPWARRIADELHQVRPLCPTFGVLTCLAGEIEKFALADPNGAERILRAYRLAPCNAAVCFTAARMDAEAGRIDQAFEKLARAVVLDGRYFASAAALCVDGLARPDMALELAGDHVGWLSQVADLLAASDPHTELAQQVRARAIGVLAARSQQTDAPAATHVSLARSDLERGDTDAAIERYRQALRKNYGHVGWHYELAALLARAGRVEEAMHEARICLRLRSDHRPARRLLEELSLLPVPMAAEQ